MTMNDNDEVFVCVCVSPMCVSVTGRVNDSTLTTNDIHRALARAAASAGSLQHCR